MACELLEHQAEIDEAESKLIRKFNWNNMNVNASSLRYVNHL